MNDARLAGEMDWDAIEDRTREFIVRTRWDSGAQILESAAKGFHMDAWTGQKNRAFVIIEKEALVGVLERACRELDVPLLAARGYPSGTVLREFCEEHVIPAQRDGQHPVIFHFGDHDPSGIDMTRDLDERLDMFCYQAGPELIRVALNMPQIARFKPPPNPAKVTDSRFAGYQRVHGDESWELDALKPEYLDQLVRRSIEKCIDRHEWEAMQQVIEGTKARIAKLAEGFDDNTRSV